jgi:hypothetical protein
MYFFRDRNKKKKNDFNLLIKAWINKKIVFVSPNWKEEYSLVVKNL